MSRKYMQLLAPLANCKSPNKLNAPCDPVITLLVFDSCVVLVDVNVPLTPRLVNVPTLTI